MAWPSAQLNEPEKFPSEPNSMPELKVVDEYAGQSVISRLILLFRPTAQE
jgi:hypothetical protein